MQGIPVIPVNMAQTIVQQKSDVISILVEASAQYLNNVNQFVSDVLAHEQEMETDLLPNIALPHAKSEAVNTPFIALAKDSEGVVWNNSNKVKLIIMIAAGKHADKEHLAIIAKLASNLADDDFVEELLNSDIDSIANKIRGLYE